MEITDVFGVNFTMRKIVLLISCLLLLTGCSDVPSPIVEETKLYDIDRNQEFKYELTPKNTAYLYNEGIKKVLAYAEGGDCFTYMVPTFHSYTQLPKNTNFNTDAYIKIESAKREVDSEPTVDNVVYTFRYVSKEDYLNMSGSLLISELLAECPTIETYEGASYEEFKNGYEEDIYSRLKVKVSSSSDIVLHGEELPSSAKVFETVYIEDGVEYKLPVATYFFDLESGNYLCLHIHVEGVEYPDLHDYSQYKNIISKDLRKQLDVYNANVRDINTLAENILGYVLVGDFSYVYSVSKPVKDTTIWERIDMEQTPEESTFEEVEDFFTDTEEVEEVESVEENQLDYNTDIQDYFQ